jgi:hypothetical protein
MMKIFMSLGTSTAAAELARNLGGRGTMLGEVKVVTIVG